VPTEEHVALECPCCRGEIYRPLNWFKQTYFTCPACGVGLSAGQFATIVGDLEQTIDDTIAEMMQGKTGCNCGGGCCKKTPE
jgi:hypothetical protein